uniref:Copia protein n=1 Tax=Cacopsylla melanoneura TaxID=428564 RepID=A0A8D8T0A7_9HEMI
MFISGDPVTYEDAIQSEEWTDAIKKELDAHEKMKTWEECDEVPKEYCPIDTNVKKARLVAKGYQEKTEEQIYSPVARLSTVRLLLSLSVQKKWKVTQMDVPTAFLNGKLEKSVYIKIPKGLKKCRGSVLKLNRALYGLKEAPKCWNETFNKFAENIGFTRSKHDVCLYTKEKCIMLLYVDDILLIGEETDKTVMELKTQFNTRDMGILSTFLGIEFEYKDDKLQFSQKSMIIKILEKFGMSQCNGASTPLEPNFIVTKEDEMELVDVPYRELIGSLLYVSMGSRPDITYAVSYLSRYLDKPNNKVWVAAKRVLRYLRATQSMSMVYEKTENMQLIGYSDSDWAADPTNRKSVTGSVIFFCGNPVAWFSKKQNCVTLSSTEAEYVAGSLVSAELIALKGIVKDLTNQQVDTVLLMDNQGAIKISQNYENSKRSKHIDVKYHFLKDSVQKKLILIQYVDTKKNIADIMTKALGRCIFSVHLVSLKLVAGDNCP